MTQTAFGDVLELARCQNDMYVAQQDALNELLTYLEIENVPVDSQDYEEFSSQENYKVPPECVQDYSEWAANGLMPDPLPTTEEPAAEDPPAEDPPAEDPPAEDPPAEDPPAEDPPAEDPPADAE